jgi:serine/threonine protein kinase
MLTSLILFHSMGSEKLAVVGSPFWMAPEVLRDEPYNEKVSLENFNAWFSLESILSRKCPELPFLFRVRIYILPAKSRAGTSQLPSE